MRAGGENAHFDRRYKREIRKARRYTYHSNANPITSWAEEDSIEQFVSETIDYLDGNCRLEPFYAAYRQDGRGYPAYHPAMLLKLLVFGYANGIRSSRKLDRLLGHDIAFRYLTANQQPNFCTISDFRKDRREGFEHLFTEIFQLCLVSGLTEVGEVVLDGQRVQGDASISRNHMREQIEAEIFADRDHFREFLTEAFLRLSHRLSFANDWIEIFLPAVQKLR